MIRAGRRGRSPSRSASEVIGRDATLPAGSAASGATAGRPQPEVRAPRRGRGGRGEARPACAVLGAIGERRGVALAATSSRFTNRPSASAVDVGEQPAVAVARLDVALEAHRGARRAAARRCGRWPRGRSTGPACSACFVSGVSMPMSRTRLVAAADARRRPCRRRRRGRPSRRCPSAGSGTRRRARRAAASSDERQPTRRTRRTTHAARGPRHVRDLR